MAAQDLASSVGQPRASGLSALHCSSCSSSGYKLCAAIFSLISAPAAKDLS